MRHALLLLAVPALLATGCSSYIAQSGRNPLSFTDREELHALLGPPASVTTTVSGSVVEEFRTREKYSEELGESGLGWMAVLTFGASEIVFFPYEVGVQLKRVLFGQTLRYEFHPDGSLALSIDGRDLGRNLALWKPPPYRDSELIEMTKRLDTAAQRTLSTPKSNQLTVKLVCRRASCPLPGTFDRDLQELPLTSPFPQPIPRPCVRSWCCCSRE